MLDSRKDLKSSDNLSWLCPISCDENSDGPVSLDDDSIYLNNASIHEKDDYFLQAVDFGDEDEKQDKNATSLSRDKPASNFLNQPNTVNKEVQQVKPMKRSMSSISFSTANSKPLNGKNSNVSGEDSSGILRSSSYASLSQLPCAEPTPIKRNISFSTLEIRNYEVVLGDNPGGSSGPPVSLGWNYDESKTKVLDMEDYEQTRETRRKHHELHLKSENRWEILLEKNEHTVREITQATEDASKMRKLRRKKPSKVSLQLDKIKSAILPNR